MKINFLVVVVEQDYQIPFEIAEHFVQMHRMYYHPEEQHQTQIYFQFEQAVQK